MEKVPLEGSVSSLLRLSLQNMMTLVSVNLMLFLDRIILAKHSIESLNAAVTVGAICNIFIFGAIAIVGIGDVFIGQYYGAGQRKKIGEILWQMMWFCLLIAFTFIAIPRLFPFQFFFGDNCDTTATTYFTWQMSLGFLPVMVAALSAFFIGTKRFGFALLFVVIASLIKFVLELPLVFGIPDIFPALGVIGAILATAISQVIHIVILSMVMLSKKNRHEYGSLNWKFRPKLFLECMKLGLPQSVGSMLNYLAWGIVVSLLAAAGQKHLMMYTVIDSTYNLLSFATEALQKSVLSISANLIGSGKQADTPKLLHKAVRLLLPILFFLSIPLLFFPHYVAQGFDIGILSPKEVSLACFVIWLYFGFDGLTWIFLGLLTAMGDTLFANPVSGMTSFVGVAATYIMTVTTHCRPEVTCFVSIIYGVISSSLLFLRYRSHVVNKPPVNIKKKLSARTAALDTKCLISSPSIAGGK